MAHRAESRARSEEKARFAELLADLCGSTLQPAQGKVHDSYFFEPLVRSTAKQFEIAELAADKAYLGRRNMETVEDLGGTPYIIFKKNTVEPKDDSVWAKMYHLFMYNREAFMFHYHKRSNAESAFSSMKQKFGDAVRSKSEVGQVNEVLAKCLCHTQHLRPD